MLQWRLNSEAFNSVAFDFTLWAWDREWLGCPALLPRRTRFGFRLAAMLPASFDLHSA